MPKDIKLKKHEEVLMAALEYTEDDLAANQSGALSAGQVVALQQRRTRQARNLVVMCALVIALASFVALAWPLAALPMLLLTLLFIGIATLNGGRAIRRMTRDLGAGVADVEGRIELDARSAENGGEYYVQLDACKFKVRREAFFAFKNRDPYRIYYAPHSQLILSVEWLRDDQPFAEADQLDLEAEPGPQVARMSAETHVSQAGAAKR